MKNVNSRYKLFYYKIIIIIKLLKQWIKSADVQPGDMCESKFIHLSLGYTVNLNMFQNDWIGSIYITFIFNFSILF